MLRLFLFLCAFLININQGRIELFSIASSKEKIIDEETVFHSVWKVQHKSKAIKINGTGFFIGPTKFVTNFHIIEALFSLEELRIVQEGTSRELRVKKLVSVSIEEDLALLETEESVSDYLNLEKEKLDSPEALYVVAYPGGEFKKINQTGVLKWNSFFSDNPYNFGASGGPVLDKNHNLVGVVFKVHYNLLFFIEIEDLKKFLEDKGFLCKELNFKGCMKRVREDFYRYVQGEKVSQDYYKIGLAFQRYEKLEFVQEQVKKWFEISAKQGHVLAQLELAKMHYKGLGTNQDFTKARELLERLANQGHALAQFELSGIYYEGLGTAQDLEKSRELLEESAKQGHVIAQYLLAKMYSKGLGTAQDFTKARELFEESAKQGYAPAQLELAEMHSKGLGTKQDFTKTREWFEEVVNQLNIY